MSIRPIATIATAIALSLAWAVTAAAHYRTGDPENPSSLWYFRGVTFDKRTGKVKDPVNFMFMGGPNDGSAYTKDRIQTHLDDDWDNDVVGGGPWRTDAVIFPLCKDDQRMFWEGFPGETSDLSDWHGTAARTGVCLNQTHARFWDDHEHARLTGDHGRLDQWVVGGIHHEHVKVKNIFKGECCATHVPDRDWSDMRFRMIQALHAHCSISLWHYHPEADGTFQNLDSDGFIARISLHHFSDGGCVGQ